MKTKQDWRSFLKSQQSSEANILLACGGATPKATQGRIETMAKDKTITQSQLEMRLVILSDLRWAYSHRTDFVEGNRDGWTSLGEGGYVKKCYLGMGMQ